MIWDQKIGTTTVVSHFVENLELKTCEDEVCLFQWRDDSILARFNAYVCDIIIADDRVSSLDQLDMQDINSVVSSPIDDFIYVENITDCEGECYSSQYKGEEVENHVLSDEGKVFDLMYHEEASFEDNDESGYSHQEEDSDNTYSSPYESNVKWEEESNDKSKYSYANRGMSFFPKSESEILFQNCAS